MSEIINQLATIEIDDTDLATINVTGIFTSFKQNFEKLDNLKDARRKHENKNFFMRWWDNNELEDAQLDSAQVQAEFSKTIGQLMLLSVMQSKLLTEQQIKLNEQQQTLTQQAEEIKKYAADHQLHFKKINYQSEALQERLDSYFTQDGVTDDQLLVALKNIQAKHADLSENFARATIKNKFDKQLLTANLLITFVLTGTVVYLLKLP